MKPRPFRIERYFAPREFSASHLLCASDCEPLTIGELLALEPDAGKTFHALRLGYTEPRGAPALREQIAGLYESIPSSDIVVHTGAEEAVYTLATAVLESGDHAIVHSPSYQSFHEVAKAFGCHVTYWDASPEDGWRPDIELLRDTVHEGTKLVVVNFPHNPTGCCISEEEWQQIIDACREHDVILFADEVYRGLEHDGTPRLSAVCDQYERGVSLGSLSKTYGLAGLRIGWIASQDLGLLRDVEEVKDYTSMCNSAASEYLATVALRNGETILERNRAIIRDNLELLTAFFERHEERFAWSPPSGGAVALPELIGRDVDEFCTTVLEATGVLLLPGTVFAPTSRNFRVGYGRRDLPEALERLEGFLTT